MVLQSNNKNIETIYFLSPVQQGMLFHTLMMPDAGLYIEQYSCLLQGILNVEAFEYAWDKVVKRHAILRTLFAWENLKQPVQVVLKSAKFTVQYQDWQNISKEEQLDKLVAFLNFDKIQPFNLSQPPLMRCTLVQIAQESFYLIWSFHHLLCDAWSVSLLFKEIFVYYDAYLEQRELQLKPAIPYKNYITWLQKQDLNQAETFWRNQLTNFDTPTLLAQKNYQNKIQFKNKNYSFSANTTTKITNFARQNRITLNILFQGAWSILLSRYSGESDIVFGVTVSGRPPSLAGIESMIGLFINTLPLRVQILENTQLIPWLKQIQAQQIEQEQYSYTSLVDIQKWSEVKSEQSLFDSILVFENAPLDSSLFSQENGLQLKNVQGISWTNYPLTLTVIPGAELTFNITYNQNCFEDNTISRMLGHLETLLLAMVTHPETPIIHLPILSQAEQKQILVAWNQTEKDYPEQEQCIHQLLTKQVEKTPDAIAVVYENQHFTYRQLNEKANQLAHYLISKGVKPETRVGICVERSIEMIIGLFGILKASGAYVPLDAEYPLQRLAYMIADADCPIILVQEHLKNNFSDYDGHLIILDQDWTEIEQQPTTQPIELVNLDNAIYLIYTSGSTGQPKGVINTHRGVTNRLLWMQETYPLTADDRILQKTPFSFDVSVWEFFWPLITGAKLIFAKLGGHRDSAYLVQLIQTQQISTIHFVPSMLRQFLAEIDVEKCISLKRVICSGEALSYDLVEQFFQKLNCDLENLYGPTEAAIDVSYWSCKILDNRTTVPIGRPVANTQLYILDSYLQPVPVGVAGELHIGGVQLARGYLNRPELTQQKFIPHPFNDNPDALLYKTGDLARYLSDGNVEYIGRIDNQIKLRGLRIELGEIEAVLNQHPQIHESVVVKRENAAGEQLVAYLVSHVEHLPQKELIEHLLSQLPAYMVPSAFVFLSSLPLTPNGKIDRKALPEPNLNKEVKTLPQTPTQELLAQIWSDILKIEQISLEDNFFSLGGHSLLATQIVSRIRQSLNVELLLSSLFSYPTLEQLAQHITTSGQLETILPPMVRVAKRNNLPLSFAQTRLWFLDQLEASSSTYHMPFVLELSGHLGRNALQQSWSTLVSRHEVLRTNFINDDGIPLQVIHNSIDTQINYIYLEDFADVEHLIQTETEKPFNLAQDRLVRMTLIQTGQDNYILVLTLHHIICDGWSINVLIQELSTLYQAYLQNQPSPLSDLSIQYADFAIWQRQTLTGEYLDKQLQYWRQKLKDCPTTLNLPKKSIVITSTNKSQTISRELDAELTQQLKTLSQKNGVTLFMLLLAAFGVLLSRYSGQNDLIIGSPIANRNRTEIESLIGFFVNTLPLRINLEDNPSFEKLLTQVRQTCLEGYAHQDIPFEKLVDELQIERNLTQNPLFQVMFDLQKMPFDQLELDNLNLKPLIRTSETAKFDLTLSFEETENQLKGTWEFNSNLYESSMIPRMIGHFETILQNLITHPAQPIKQISILTQAELDTIVIEWNQTEQDYPSQCIHQLFETQVETTPDAVAVVYQNQYLTYRQLNEKANHIAHYLISQGVKPETLVGICVERSLEMIIGVLAILKAGGAYVPLDANYPASRLDYIFNETQINILLTQHHLQQKFIKKVTHIHCLDTDVSSDSITNPITFIKPHHLAYIIYTSGSTGQPKGVMIEHQGLVNIYHAWESAYQLKTNCHYLQMASFSFDVFTGDWVRCLCSGGKLVICPQEKLLEPEQLYQLIQQENVDCGDFVPAVVRNLMQYLIQTQQKLESMKLLIVGSDTWYWHEHQTLQQLCGQQTRIINAYGVTEATIDSSYFQSTTVEYSSDKIVPIGKPFTNTQLYILDSDLQPVPVGVVGELHIGGIQLARGYLNRPELTQQKFIPHPFSESDIARLYKTGDLARYLNDGNIEYIGRIDTQIKLRGLRIELGEIEAVLNQHPQIQESVVIKRENSTGNQQLVAYLVSNPELPSLAEIQEHLQLKLSAYMIPSAFVFLDSLPLTPNGKIDRKALPEPNLKTQVNTLPQTPTQELLAQIWSDILKIEQINLEDNFFALGGHSLLATQIVSRIRQSLNVELPLSSLFSHPTLEQLAQHITTSVQPEIILPPIVRVTREENLPLSFAQTRLWFLDQLEGLSSIYNMPFVLELSGQLNRDALQQSWSTLVSRHEVLRTNFINDDGIPVQVIHEEVDTQIKEIDVTEFSEIPHLISTEIETPFNLAQDPLGRISLIKKDENNYLLVLNLHHIICDGWSMGVLIHELSTLYQAYINNQPSPLSGLSIQYADFAIWQRQSLTGEYLDKQLQYWRQQLKNCPTTLNLPKKLTPTTASIEGGSITKILDLKLTQQLKTLSQKNGVTLFMVLLAAFGILLSRYSGQNDIIIGSPIANRNRTEIEPLIGFFVNTLPLRINLEDNPSFEKLLTQVRQTCLAGYAHQDIPFEKLVDELQIERNLTQNPLFQVMFDLQKMSFDQLELDNLNLKPLIRTSETAKFDLTLSFEETENQLIGKWEYKTKLFESAMIHRMIEHFETLLQNLITHPAQPIKQINILTQVELNKILIEWNQTEKDYPSQCIHQLFETQVEKTPDAVAVVFEDQNLTYRQLNTKANQLAHYLQKQEVKPETLVGICVERSLEMMIGLLAILKAGGVYLPLDPTYPKERLDYIIQDAQVSLLLTQSNFEFKEVEKKIYLDREWELINQENSENPKNQVTPENLAYIIYTSGSTGKPKGVEILQSALVNFLLSMQEVLQLSPDDTLLGVTTLSFDIAALELYLPLIVGAKVVLVSREVASDGYQLLDKMNDITIMQATPATWQLLLSVGWSENEKLKILCGGEVLDTQLAQQLLKRGQTVWNLYGPTETTIWSSMYHLNSSSVLIGRAIANTQFYVLDTHLQPVPIGVSGELYIGGAGLARGYVNRADLTAERFIFHPYGRLYKTGDLVRYLYDGNLEYLGRLDSQVKIRGFRIELGEIETILNQHPEIEKAVVIVREDDKNDKRLVAYLISETSLDIKNYLRDKLPQYMIPASFVWLDAFPLTPNGKIDRKALPKPYQTRESQTLFNNPTQELLAQIWSDILKIDNINLKDNFFELGGHSLLATQIVSRIRQSLKVELPLSSLFSYPTLEQLTQQITTTHQQENLLPPIVRVVNRDNLPLSFAQTRLWFLDQLEASSSTYHMPFVLELSGHLDRNALQQSWSTLVSRHEVLRTNFINDDGIPLQVIHNSIDTQIKINSTHLSKIKQSEQILHLIQTETEKPFNLAQDPLARITLIKKDENNYFLILNLHHIICDGWSMGVLIQELSTLYQAYTNNQPSPLSDLSIQYADFAIWQRQTLTGDYLDKQLQYWRQQLQNCPTTLTLPYDYTATRLSNPQNETIQIQLDSDVTQKLKTLSQQNGVTLFMLLLTSFSVLLSRYSGQNDLIIGSPIANRNRAEMEPLIGFFVNSLPIRINLENNPSFSDLLQQVKQTCLEGYAHQDIPFEKLVDELQIERNLRQNPLFQVMFDLQNESMSQFNLESLNLTPFPIQTQTAKFNLSLSFKETDLGLLGEWEYDFNLFHPDTIKRLNQHLQNLLQVILSHPTESIQNLPLLSEQEQQQILFEWNPTENDLATTQCLHQLFESQVEKTPDAIAVVFENQHLTYRQLNEKANSVAHYLQSLGVQPETCVGLFIERSIEMLIGLLGILKAGGAYLPLDPMYSLLRLDYILEDAQINTVLTLSKFQANFSEKPENILYLDTDWSIISSYSTNNPISPVHPKNLAYIIYTSGSTGQPKGVMIEHQAVVNFIQTAIETYHFSPVDKVLQFATISFDAAVEEIYCTLCTGATLYLRNEHLLDSYDFLAKSEQWGLTVWDLPTAYWHQLTHHLTTNHLKLPSSIRLVIIGGEAASVQTVNLWLDQVGDYPLLLNTYGPTETTVVATVYPITQQLDSNSVPIGHPINTTQIYILDNHQQPVPIGVTGELHIGGRQLARGYLNSPELTQEKFIPNPFSRDSLYGVCTRLYKTGDKARYLPNGLIEYIGRIDNQIKLRGLRIEISEIETVLLQNSDITDAVVICRENTTGDTQLIAYLVTHSEHLSPTTIRQFLQNKLPSYMIPTRFVFLKSLPLTSNGKIDRKALPIADTNIEDANFIAPRDIIEKQLSIIWSEILGINSISIQDNFFEIGGHSLLAVRLMSSIKQQLGQSLPLATLFSSPTIEQLANLIRQNHSFLDSPLVRIQPKGTQSPLFFVHPVGGMVLCYFDLAQQLGTDRPFYGLQAANLDKMNRVEEMAQYYLEAIQTQQPQGPYLLSGWSFGGLIAYEMAQQLQQQGQTVAFVGLIDTYVLKNETLEFDNPLNLLADLFNIDLPAFKIDISELSQEQQFILAFETAQKMNLITEDFDIEQANYFWQVYQKNINALNDYQPQPYAGQVTLFQATGNNLTQDMTNNLNKWSDLATGGINVYSVSSNHYMMVRPPFVTDLASSIKQCLEEIK